MRGTDMMQEVLFTTVHLETFVPADHPLRPIRKLVNEALGRLSGLFGTMYADGGRESVAPERLLRALLLQVFYSIRSERLLVEQISYNLLFRWFIGLTIDDPVWNHSTFSKNRDRLLEHEAVAAFFREVLELAERRGWLSREHFTVDGTLIQAWASHKSFRPKDEPPEGGGDAGRNPSVDFRGHPRSNETHCSTTDPEARLYRKSQSTAAILCYQGHVLMENRSGLVLGAQVSEATGKAERETALAMLAALPGAHRKTVAADKAYDTADFVAGVRELGITPHVAQNTTNRQSAIDGRTVRHPGYAVSQRTRKLIEERFGWAKTVGNIRQTVFRGLERVGQHFTLTMAACNLVRMRTLLAAEAGP